MRCLTCLLWIFSMVCLSSCFVDKTVYQYLVDNNYSSFLQLLRETHQDGVLQGKGPVTLFAPSNIAISRLDPDVMATLARSTWQKNILVKYHMINDFLLIPEMAGTKLMTEAGENIDLLHIGHSLILNQHTRVDSPPNNDIVCNNGIIQPIDNVLIPPTYSTDNLVATLIEKDQLFNDFAINLLIYNLTTLLESGEYTIFAPTNSAYLKFLGFSALRGKDTGYNVTQAEREMIAKESQKYHIVPGARTFDMLKHGQQLFTLHGTPLNITELIAGKMVNQAHIVQPDIAASNGIIHAIDDALFPTDLLHYMPVEYQKIMMA